jgi:hypothetical protein
MLDTHLINESYTPTTQMSQTPRQSITKESIMTRLNTQTVLTHNSKS